MNKLFISLLILTSITLSTKANESITLERGVSPECMKDKPKEKKIVYQATIIFTPENIDSSVYYIRGIASAFKGGIVRDDNDTMIITVLQDSLKRAIYFLDKLGTVEKKKVIKSNETSRYYEIKELLEPMLVKLEAYTKELREAEEHPDAVKAENKILPLNEKINPLLRELKRIEFGSKYTYITIYFKKEGE